MARWLGLTYSILLMALICSPTIRWLSLGKPDGTLYGYVDQIPARPKKMVKAFYAKELQAWAERYWDTHIGFRALLIRSFNEINFRLFKEMPRLHLYSTPEQGLFSSMSIESLNHEITNKKSLEDRYREEASKLLSVQNLLEADGKLFIAIIASSKPYVYSESLGPRFVVGGSEAAYQRAASFGAALRNAGVNVIDSGHFLRRLTKTQNIETHPASGVHWNYYAGCIVAKQLMEVVRSKFPAASSLDCGEPTYAPAHMVDVDGLLLMNILSDGGLIRMSPYPSIGKFRSGWRPKIVSISDSFIDQICHSLRMGQIYEQIVNAGYFSSREIAAGVDGFRSTHDAGSDVPTVRVKLLEDIRECDVVVLEMVDYNVQRWGYGFPDYLIQKWN
jgi:hypothetical protein